MLLNSAFLTSTPVRTAGRVIGTPTADFYWCIQDGTYAKRGCRTRLYVEKLVGDNQGTFTTAILMLHWICA
jgi:hypothetical protein